MAKQITLTASEAGVLRFYRDFKSEHFCCSIKTIAEHCSVGTRTVQRANEKFQRLGILSWISGNSASWRPNSRGQANRYRLMLKGIEGSAITPAESRRLRRLSAAQVSHSPRLATFVYLIDESKQDEMANLMSLGY